MLVSTHQLRKMLVRKRKPPQQKRIMHHWTPEELATLRRLFGGHIVKCQTPNKADVRQLFVQFAWYTRSMSISLLINSTRLFSLVHCDVVK
jgi:hypothetical protein